ncbi:TPA: hypothetical protein HA246_00570, partial [Candidatus Woesearchaeota archaeon]|nr:hypothetical protein [Candidatus Woesearchaeota archaeon]
EIADANAGKVTDIEYNRLLTAGYKAPPAADEIAAANVGKVADAEYNRLLTAGHRTPPTAEEIATANLGKVTDVEYQRLLTVGHRAPPTPQEIADANADKVADAEYQRLLTAGHRTPPSAEEVRAATVDLVTEARYQELLTVGHRAPPTDAEIKAEAAKQGLTARLETLESDLTAAQVQLYTERVSSQVDLTAERAHVNRLLYLRDRNLISNTALIDLIVPDIYKGIKKEIAGKDPKEVANYLISLFVERGYFAQPTPDIEQRVEAYIAGRELPTAQETISREPLKQALLDLLLPEVFGKYYSKGSTIVEMQDALKAGTAENPERRELYHAKCKELRQTLKALGYDTKNKHSFMALINDVMGWQEANK